MTEKTREFYIPGIIAAVISVIIWLAGLAATAFPDTRLWGFNHLLFVDSVFTYIYIAGGALALLLFIPAVRDMAGRGINRLAALFDDSPRRLHWAVIAALSVPVLWFCRMPVSFLGDGYTVINNVGNDLPVVLKWSEIGSISVVYVLSQVLPATGLEAAALAYALISVVSGGVTLYFFFALAHELSSDRTGRWIILAFLVLSGWMLLFFGYAENYPILWPFVTGYIYFSLRYLSGKGGLILPTILLAAATALHLLVIFFALSYLPLLVSRGWGKRIFRRYRVWVWTALALAVAAGLFLFIRQYQQSLEFKLHFIPIFAGRPEAPGYALFSWPHLVDLLNEARLLLPLGPALLLPAWPVLRGRRPKAHDWFLLVFSLGGLAFLLMIDPRLGMGRDWDLFALCCLGPMVILLKGFAAAGEKAARYAPGLMAMSLILIMPYFAVNLSYQPAIDYFQWLMRKDVLRAKPGMCLLRLYYRNLGDDKMAEIVDREIIATYPFNRIADEAVALAQSGRKQEALRLADSLFDANPYAVESFSVRGLVNLNTGKYASAIRDLERAAELGLYNAPILVNLAQAYYLIGKPDLMMKHLRQAQKYDRRNFSVLTGLAAAFSRTGVYDSALVYADRIIRSDSLEVEAYWIAGYAAFRLGRSGHADQFLSRYLALSPDGPNRSEAEKMLEQLR